MTDGTEGGGAEAGRRPDAFEGAEAPSRRGGCLLFFVVAGGCFFLLRDFTETVTATLLAPIAAALGIGGVYMTLGGLRHLFAGPWYSAVAVVGVAMLAGAGAALSPAAPGAWLERVPPARALLLGRIARLEAAIEAKDVELASKLASRGLGDPQVLDAAGNPLLHRARSGEMVAALLDAGLDPDASDERGHTLLMRSTDVSVSRLLLEAGADPNARDRHGLTPLMHRGGDPAELALLLLEAGADVHAVSDVGRTVADLVRGPGRPLLARYAGGRPLRETGGAAPQGQGNWLVASPGPAGRVDASGVALEGDPLEPGDVGSVSIVVDNPTPRDRVLDVRAVLDNGVLFVAASHGGAVMTRGRLGPTSIVRWPLLAMPPGGQGRLTLDALARPDDVVADLVTGDWSIDVRVVDMPQREERVLRLYQERAGPAARVQLEDGTDFVVTMLIAAVPVAVIWFAFYWMSRRRKSESGSQRTRRVARTGAAAVAVLSFVTAGNLVWSVLEPFVRFDATSCEVLDHRVLATAVESRSGSDSGNGSGSRSVTTMQAHPLAAVAIDVGGQRVVTAGWATGATRSIHELRDAPIGSTVTCWLDPADRGRFTLRRDPSMGSLVGVAMLVTVGVPMTLVAIVLGRGRARPPSEPADDSCEGP